MTRRGARLVAGTAALALAAAALAAAAPLLPAGLAAAVAPGLVLREASGGLLLLSVVLLPALLADDPAREAEDHTVLAAACAAAPPLAALAVAAGLPASALLPPAALLLACDGAASSWMRLDRAGRSASAWAAVATLGTAGVPFCGWALADLAGLEGGDALAAASPLSAMRRAAEGRGDAWSAVAGPALGLLALGVAFRVAAALRRPAESGPAATP